MCIFSKCIREHICHIFGHVYIAAVDYSAFVQISNDVIASVDVLVSSLEDSSNDSSESTLIVTVDWQQWRVSLRTVNILLHLE